MIKHILNFGDRWDVARLVYMTGMEVSSSPQVGAEVERESAERLIVPQNTIIAVKMAEAAEKKKTAPMITENAVEANVAEARTVTDADSKQPTTPEEVEAIAAAASIPDESGEKKPAATFDKFMDTIMKLVEKIQQMISGAFGGKEKDGKKSTKFPRLPLPKDAEITRGKYIKNDGTKLNVATGTNVTAMETGTITKAKNGIVEVSFGSGYKIIYKNVNISQDTTVNKKIEAGAMLGTVGENNHIKLQVTQTTADGVKEIENPETLIGLNIPEAGSEKHVGRRNN